MNTTVVLFEDHTWRGLRPLAASLPTYEQRCGIFNTRERVELLQVTGDRRPPGVLLGRTYLEALRGDGPWALGTASLDDGTGDSAPRQLWLTGRLAPAVSLVKALLALPEGTPPFEWRDGEGLVAALLTPAQGRLAAAAWEAWRDGRTSQWSVSTLGGSTLGDSTLGSSVRERSTGEGHTLACAANSAHPEAAADALAGYLAAATEGMAPALRHAWDIVPATACALAADLQAALDAGGWSRRPFALIAAEGSAPAWSGRTELRRCDQGDLPPGVWLLGDVFHRAAGVTLAPGVVIDARRGPVVLDLGCDVAPHTLLEGPLYLGPGCRVKAGARLYGESSFGVGNRLAGEIGESTFGDFANKQHEGFIGHAVLGSWTNLGAMTTCSDLKNNYGTVRVDLGDGQMDTGQRFVGLLAGDHVKTAIGTLFNTGTSVGFASNIFGGGMPPKFVPAFSWGGAAGAPGYGVGQAVATAAVVMGRRQCRFLPAHRDLFETLSTPA